MKSIYILTFWWSSSNTKLKTKKNILQYTHATYSQIFFCFKSWIWRRPSIGPNISKVYLFYFFLGDFYSFYIHIKKYFSIEIVIKYYSYQFETLSRQPIYSMNTYHCKRNNTYTVIYTLYRSGVKSLDHLLVWLVVVDLCTGQVD